MKIMACGDLHLTDQKPANRIDANYLDVISGKLDFIFETGDKKGCKFLVFPGDVFNTHRANDLLKAFLAEKIMSCDMEVFATFGQHDMRYHSSDVQNTPLNVLYKSEVLEILGANPIVSKMVNFYGASFGEEIPEPKQEGFNVLVIHTMIIQDKLWEGQEEFKRANILLRNTPYDLIISGDNHTFFTQQYKDKTLINCGSVMRSSINQANHKPHIVFFDTDTRKKEEIPIPCEDFHDIMNTQTAIQEKERQEKERSEELEAFIKTLSSETDIEGLDLDFVKNLRRWLKQGTEIDENVLKIIDEIMEDTDD